ncbi:MAG: phenylacetate-CoA oxygenase subunit PaaJ [Sulfobacillus acidophilus]|uniref:Phenylacetate-CoA oxygenase subunit PaaJ n=1 Tax=Sulfobacillus acidophilus TaxID=53633 RepID=A0A2T2WFQ5_9FIRM|nr:MAG: phenylacetate-CoA oxygenase subunit PaaJ [Sulfobacillus acidophilus]
MTEDDVYKQLQTVYDPEIPNLSIVDLGMVTAVAVQNDEVHITVRPTFIGCPAVDWIRKQIEEAIDPSRCLVQIDPSSTWSTEHISETGRRALKTFGIAPPSSGDTIMVCPLCGSERTRRTSLFGTALCRSSYYCENCRQPFEGFKTL